jgi:hypothetical protein
LLIASASSAQQTLSGLAGVVRDSTAKPVAGVSVEASSPVLIERSRSVTTDGNGQYQITDLQPGTYSVTFKAPGFTTFKNDGIELTAGFTGTVNATLRAGNPTETITVTGTTTQIDTRTAAQQNVVTSQTATSGRDATAAVSVTRGLTQATTDVGGAAGAYTAQGNSLTVRGKAGVKRLFDGLRVENAEGIGNTSYMINSATVEQVVVETGGGSAESLSAGGSINNVPKSGSNQFAFRLSGLVSKEGMQSDNLDDPLRARGLTAVNKVGNIWDATAAAGGPILKDKLWFWAAPKMWGNRNYAAGLYWNDTQGTPFFTPANGTGIDLFGVRRAPAGLPVRRADQFEVIRSQPVRLTWQASPRNKLNFFVDYPEAACTCRSTITTTAPEVGTYIFGRKGHLWELGLFQATWTSPRSSRLLMEGGASFAFGGWPQVYQPTVGPNDISVIDTALGWTYNDRQGVHQGLASDPNHVSDRASERFTTSYITGSHAIKMGISLEHAWHEGASYVNHNINYTFNSGVPNRISEYSTPYLDKADVKAELALFAQDQWTVKRLTLNYGLRYSYFNAGVPALHANPTTFVPFPRDFAEVNCVPCWHDIDPRVGGAYDIFGNGKTALKGSFGRYVSQQIVAIATANSPFQTSVNSVTRTWTPSTLVTSPALDGNYLYNCDLANPLANGDCGQISDLNFGLANPKATRYAADVVNGWGIRPFIWDSSIEIQHQLTRSVTVTAGYYRNWAANFSATDNTLVAPGDYSPFCVATPLDPRLPGGGGQQLCGLYDVSVPKFGQVTNVITQSSHFGKQTSVNDFIGFSFNARLPKQGARVGVNVDTGRTVTDACYVVTNPAQSIYDLGGSTATAVASPTYCHVVTPFIGNLSVKLNGVYPLPYDFSVSANYQNSAGAQDLAIWNAPNSAIAPSLGRNLAACGTRPACTATFAVPLIQPGSQYEARRNQLDLRLGKSLQLARRVRFTGDLGIYNVLNNNTITAIQTTYGPQWLKPTTVMYGRLLQASARLDF